MRKLVAWQVINGFVGLLQTIIVSRLLGPHYLGIVASAAAFALVALNFFDLRLQDVASKLLNDAPALTGRSNSQIVTGTLLVQSMLGLLGWLMAMVSAAYLQRYFLTVPVQFSIIALVTGAAALNFISNPLQYLLRFAATPENTARIQCTILTTSSIFLLGSLALSGSPQIYPVALFVSALLSLILNLAVTAHHFKLTYTSRGVRDGLLTVWKERKLLAATNVLGYSKMLHRGADVLLVAYVSNETITGMYKLARTLTDALFLGIDVLQRQFQPDLFRWVGESNPAPFRDFSLRSSKLALAALLLLPVAIFPLRWLVPLIFGEQFVGCESFLVLQIIPQIISAGMALWLWPLFLMKNAIGKLTIVSILLVLVIQYGLALPIALYFGQAPRLAGLVITVGNVIIFPLNTLYCLWFVRKRYPEYIGHQ